MGRRPPKEKTHTTVAHRPRFQVPGLLRESDTPLGHRDKLTKTPIRSIRKSFKELRAPGSAKTNRAGVGARQVPVLIL